MRFLKPFSLILAAALLLSVPALALNPAEVKVGSVSGNDVNLRAAPSLDAKVLRQGYDGEFIVVLEKAGDEWFKVNYQGTTGYMFGQYVTLIPEADFDPIPGHITGNAVNLRAGPSTDDGKLGRFNTGDPVTVTGVYNGWFKIDHGGQAGYIHPDFMALDIKTETTVAAAPEAFATAPAALPADASLAAQVIDYAKQFIGCKYKYGSMNGKTFDCSGFTSYVFKNFGVSLNRSAAGQLSNGSAVGRDDLQPGDLVLFADSKIRKAAASHVGIYLGNGEFIHASSRRAGGTVTISSLGDSYYNRVFKSGRRVL
jgi:cell wall-associated NlpC family hydrolase